MFGTFLLFILYFVVSIGMFVCLGIAIFLMLKAKNELTQPRVFIDIMKEPLLFLSESEFSEKGNQYRIQFLNFLSISAGLIILMLILKLILS